MKFSDDIKRLAEGERFGYISYDEQRRTFMIFLCKRTGDDVTVLTVGEERTAEEAEAWLTATEKLMAETGREDVDAPDMWDRKS